MLNAAVCRNLAADFAELEAKAMEMLGASSWFGRLYTDMRRAVEFAADEGALLMGLRGHSHPRSGPARPPTPAAGNRTLLIGAA